jgi:hypothetical protein
MTEWANEGVYRLGNDPVNPTKVYVGKSENIERRIAEHHAGPKNKFSTELLYRLPLLTKTHIDDPAMLEEHETLCNMKLLGIRNVEGSVHCNMSYPSDWRIAFKLICARFNLCYTCGKAGHMASKCDAPRFSDWNNGF